MAATRKPTRRCTKCDRPAAPGHRQCRAHVTYFREYRRKRRDAGRCIQCGAAARGYQLCPACAERSSELMRDRYRERRDAGRCVVCGAAARGESMCKPCAAHKAAGRRRLRAAES